MRRSRAVSYTELLFCMGDLVGWHCFKASWKRNRVELWQWLRV